MQKRTCMIIYYMQTVLRKDNINSNCMSNNISPRLQQYNNPESYAMGKEAAKFLIGQLFVRQITPAEFEKQFGTVEKYICWYELHNDLPNSFITDGEEMCELLKMISPSGAEDYKQECLKRMAESKKMKEERERKASLENMMSSMNLTINPPTASDDVTASATTVTSSASTSTDTPVVVDKPKKKTPGRKKKDATASK
jgi:hypothetical protein